MCVRLLYRDVGRNGELLVAVRFWYDTLKHIIATCNSSTV